MDESDARRTPVWSAEQTAWLESVREVRIAVDHADGRAGRGTPIWVVVVDGEVVVRTWYPRENGWYGRATASQRARLLVDGEEVPVRVERSTVPGADDAYRAKYGNTGASSMVTADAAATTLRLVPVG